MDIKNIIREEIQLFFEKRSRVGKIYMGCKFESLENELFDAGIEFIKENSETSDVITVFHGTKPNKLSDIKSKGLESSTGYHNAQWYMVSTDMGSALFHAHPEFDGGDVYVFEFEVPVTNEKWEGYPYFWPGEVRNPNSSWYALKNKLPPEFIKKIHKMSNKTWKKQKNKGF